MNCENAQQNIILAQYGELPDELQFPLEQHLAGCEDCRREWKALHRAGRRAGADAHGRAFAEPAGRFAHAAG